MSPYASCRETGLAKRIVLMAAPFGGADHSEFLFTSASLVRDVLKIPLHLLATGTIVILTLSYFRLGLTSHHAAATFSKHPFVIWHLSNQWSLRRSSMSAFIPTGWPLANFPGNATPSTCSSLAVYRYMLTNTCQTQIRR